jgi:hypothetical protein
MSRRTPPWRSGRRSSPRPDRSDGSDGSANGGAGGSSWERHELGGGADALELVADADDAELLEFLEADVVGSRADPAFKEALREKLWRIVRTRYAGGTNDGES